MNKLVPNLNLSGILVVANILTYLIWTFEGRVGIPMKIAHITWQSKVSSLNAKVNVINYT